MDVRRTNLRWLVGVLLAATALPSFGTGMVTCKEIGAVSTGIGWRARGRFSNDDYGFSVRVPTGVTAWSGVAKEAPFHGFGFRLNSSSRSCIDLELGWRVDSDEPPSLPSGMTPIPMAGATAGVAEIRGQIHETPFLNRIVYFTSKQGDGFVDGRITLVVPTRDEKRARAIFDAFVRSLTFSRD
jgi:hypothetical protein